MFSYKYIIKINRNDVDDDEGEKEEEKTSYI